MTLRIHRHVSTYGKAGLIAGPSTEKDARNKLLTIREACEMTQAQMAAALDISLRAYQEQESLSEPKRSYVLAAEQIQRRMELDSIDVRQALPSEADELRAQIMANNNLISHLYALVQSMARANGAELDIAKTPQILNYSSNDPKQDLLSRRANHLATQQLELFDMLF